jgi:hypothetical protein
MKPTYKNIFILGTGRCGTLSFAKACSHIKNYTAAHESKISAIEGRFNYPEYHIEVDNRLSWFLGILSRKYKNQDTLYVHLYRNKNDVVNSFMDRKGYRAISDGFIKNICLQTNVNDNRQILLERMVDTVRFNIEEFFENRNYEECMEIKIETIQN